MAILSRHHAGFIRRCADGTLGFMTIGAEQMSLGSQGQETRDEMAAIACEVQSLVAFLEQEVSILRTHG